jgi:hypothetical protein
MSTRKRRTPSSRRSSTRRRVRNSIIQIAKETKDRRILNRLSRLTKHYKLYNKKEDLMKIESLIKSAYPNMRIDRTNSITSEDKDGFINFLAQLANNESPVRETHAQTLNRFLKQ